MTVLDKLLGAWKVVQLVSGGIEQNDDPHDEHFLWFTSSIIITGDKWAAWDMPFQLHKSNPMNIDIQRDDLAEPWLQPCILDVADNVLFICGAGSLSQPRPSTFDSTIENGQTLYVAKRCNEPVP